MSILLFPSATGKREISKRRNEIDFHFILFKVILRVWSQTQLSVTEHYTSNFFKKENQFGKQSTFMSDLNWTIAFSIYSNVSIKNCTRLFFFYTSYVWIEKVTHWWKIKGNCALEEVGAAKLFLSVVAGCPSPCLHLSQLWLVTSILMGFFVLYLYKWMNVTFDLHPIQWR